MHIILIETIQYETDTHVLAMIWFCIYFTIINNYAHCMDMQLRSAQKCFQHFLIWLEKDSLIRIIYKICLMPHNTVSI